MKKSLKPGDPAPDIALPDQDGTPRKLSQMKGKWVLIYFYPRDDTPGCTVEACGLRDAHAAYAKAGIEVVGISADTVKSHRKFVDKFALPFVLLSDTEKDVIRAWGAWGKKKFMGREFDGILRSSFLVDPRGRIAKVYPKVKPAEHAEEVLADVRAAATDEPAGKTAAASATPRKARKKPSGSRAKPRARKPRS